MRWKEILKKKPKIKEHATVGATNAGSVATISGGLGGFDPDGDYGIYPNPKKKKKNTVIRRPNPID